MLYLNQEMTKLSLAESLKKIQDSAKRIFGWVPRALSFMDEPFFKQKELEELSDSKIDLTAAIESRLPNLGKVLTTPAHKNIFKDLGVENVAIYDISPLQLATTEETDETYWCDIFCSSALATLLSKAQANTIYLSNIPEWATEGTNQLEELAITLNQDAMLENIMFASVICTGGDNEKFSQVLSDLGWEATIFQEQKNEPEKVFVLSRKLSTNPQKSPIGEGLKSHSHI